MEAQYDRASQLPNSNYLQNCISHCTPLDYYIFYQTGEQEYQCLIYNKFGKAELATIYRENFSGYNTRYNITWSSTSDLSYYYDNELFVYSNLGIGTCVYPPSIQAAADYGLLLITCLVSLLLMFRGLTKCFKRRKNYY